MRYVESLQVVKDYSKRETVIASIQSERSQTLVSRAFKAQGKVSKLGQPQCHKRLSIDPPTLKG